MAYEKYYPGGWQSGQSGGTPITPEALAHIEEGILAAFRATTPRNLLDNSDFTKPVNPLKFTSGAFAAGKYFIPRWVTLSAYLTLTLDSDGLTIANGYTAYLYPEQRLEKGIVEAGKTYACAIWHSDGTVDVHNITTVDSKMVTSGVVANNVQVAIAMDNSGYDRVCLMVPAGKTATIARIALYEGAYTADNLPGYRVEEESAKEAACRRYFQRIGSSAGVNIAGYGIITSAANKTVRITIPCAPMRVPAVAVTLEGSMYCTGVETDAALNEVVSCEAGYENGAGYYITFTLADTPTGGAQLLRLAPGAFIHLDAEL